MDTANLTLQRSSTAMLLIDVQERINSVMTDQRHLDRNRVLLQAMKVLDVPVVTTEQYPKGLGPTAELLGPLLPSAPLEKETFSCMRQPEVVAALKALGKRQIVATGIESHVCVLQTALDLIEDGFSVFVPHDAVCSRRPSDKKWALHRMSAAGAIITSTESALFELLDRCGTSEFKAVSKMIREIPV